MIIQRYKIIKPFLIGIHLLTFACSKDPECCTIIEKSISNGQFVFVGSIGSNANPTNDGIPNTIVNLEVSQSDYNSYEIGDKYCFD
tara:strand:- start:1144 stop:1401 length:258 start_codon:yes stop_codon:yes gene_type:complete